MHLLLLTFSSGILCFMSCPSLPLVSCFSILFQLLPFPFPFPLVSCLMPLIFWLKPPASLLYFEPHPSPLTSHPSPLTPHPSPHPSPLTSHLSPPHPSPLIPHPSPLTPHLSPLTSHLSPLTTHPSPLTPLLSLLTSHLFSPCLVSPCACCFSLLASHVPPLVLHLLPFTSLLSACFLPPASCLYLVGRGSNRVVTILVPILNTGQVNSSPQVTGKGTVVISYTRGDVCDSGTYTTNVTFICKRGSMVSQSLHLVCQQYFRKRKGAVICAY